MFFYFSVKTSICQTLCGFISHLRVLLHTMPASKDTDNTKSNQVRYAEEAMIISKVLSEKNCMFLFKNQNAALSEGLYSAYVHYTHNAVILLKRTLNGIVDSKSIQVLVKFYHN